MRKVMSVALICLLTISGFIGVANVTSGQAEGSGLADSPWPCFGHDRRNTGRSPYDTSDVDGAEKWKYDAHFGITSSPSIDSDGTIYFTTGSFPNREGYLVAINSDGTEKWNFTTDGFTKDSSPAIASDGTIYVGSWADKLCAVNQDGTEKWNFTTNHRITSSPTIGTDGTIYFSDSATNLYALHPNGTEKWSLSFDGGSGTSPVIGSDGDIYFTSGRYNGKLFGVTSDGTKKWNYSIPEGVSSPTIGNDGTIYFGSGIFKDDDGCLYAIKPDGSKRWKFNVTGNILSSPAVGEDGTVYLGSWSGDVYAIDPNGTEKWNFSLESGVISSPVIGGEGTIYVGSNGYIPGRPHIMNSSNSSSMDWEIAPQLYAFTPEGTVKWNTKLKSSVDSLAIGEEGTLYIDSFNGNLYAFSGSEEVSLTTYQMVILAVAIITVITIVIWKKKGSERVEEKIDDEEPKKEREDIVKTSDNIS